MKAGFAQIGPMAEWGPYVEAAPAVGWTYAGDPPTNPPW
jgi:hypothetical protein